MKLSIGWSWWPVVGITGYHTPYGWGVTLWLVWPSIGIYGGYDSGGTYNG